MPSQALCSFTLHALSLYAPSCSMLRPALCCMLCSILYAMLYIENRKVYRSGTASSAMRHEERKYTCMNAINQCVWNLLWKKDVGMPEIWEEMRAIPSMVSLHSSPRDDTATFMCFSRIRRSRFTVIAFNLQ